MRILRSVLVLARPVGFHYVSIFAVLVGLILVSGCATSQGGAAPSKAPDVQVSAGSGSPSSSDDSLMPHTANPELMPDIRKASNLGILFRTLEVPTFTHGEDIPSHHVEALRTTIMERMREEGLFEQVVTSTTDHQNTLILNARVISWEKDAIEVSLAVDTRCGCRLGEALGKGTTQVTDLSAGETARGSDIGYDLDPVADGAVQYVASVMGAKAG